MQSTMDYAAMASDPPQYEIGQSQRSNCGHARATYRPDWSPELPWVTYTNGTARRHFGSLRGALFYLERDWGYSFTKTTVE
jgi:hypothetical protein